MSHRVCDSRSHNLNRVARDALVKRPNSGEGPALQIFQRRAVEAEGAARAEARRWECAWNVRNSQEARVPGKQ